VKERIKRMRRSCLSKVVGVEVCIFGMWNKAFGITIPGGLTYIHHKGRWDIGWCV
jgi:hypothetical protein